MSTHVPYEKAYMPLHKALCPAPHFKPTMLQKGFDCTKLKSRENGIEGE